MTVRKSNGSLEEFDKEKVKLSICKAYQSINEVCNDLILDTISSNLYLYDNISTNEIRRQVEDALMSINKKVARAFSSNYEDKLPMKKKQDFIKSYIEASNAATGSKFDSNANVSNKNIVTLGQELYKENNIKQNRYILCDKIRKIFSKKLADQYLEDLESHILYKHDESGTPGYPYCVAITMYPFLVDGLTKLGGQSTKPTDLKSFCGEFINLIYSISSQYMGACNPYSQRLIYNNGENTVSEKFGDFVGRFDLDKSFSNYQGEWEYKDISNEGYKVAEDGRFVGIKKVYRRKYNGKILKISTKSGYSVKVSEDHKFKTQYRGRTFDVKAKDLLVGDTVFMNKDFSLYINKNSSDFKKGWLMGMICGDGCLTNENNVSLSVNYEQEYLGDKFNEYLDFFNLPLLNKNQGHKCYSYAKRNKELYDFFKRDISGISAYDKHIDVNGKTLDYLVGFLDGLFSADGSYSEKRGIRISLTNEKLIKNIEQILEELNIPYNPHSIVEVKGNRKESYSLYIKSTIIKYLDATKRKLIKCGKIKDIDSSREIYYYGIHAATNAKSNSRNVVKLITDSHDYYHYNTDVIYSIEEIANDDDYVYEIETESHYYNDGGFITHNCASPEFLMYMDFFIRRDYGDNYLDRLDEVVDLSAKQRTLTQVIDNCFQQVVHSMNMPAGNRGYQTVFWNIGYFDKPYFEGVFGDFMFPDGSKPKWETLSWLQKHFMKWFNKEREKYILTFPVETMALLTDGNDDFLDKEYADFTAEMWSEGHSFFCYLSDNPDALSSCCFKDDQKVLWKSSDRGVQLTTLKDLYDMKWEGNKKNFRVYHNGSWVEGKAIKLPNRQIYKVVTDNNKELYMTDNHINVTLSGEKTTENLTTDDYLMFNTQVLNSVPENDEGLTYEQGFVVGAFLGDGSFGSKMNDGIIYEINFSQNANKYEKMMEMIDIANKQLGGEYASRLNEVYNNVYPVRISSKELASLIIKWTNWERGTYAWNKELNLNCLLQSVEFRKGILDGWYNTDGGNSNRCYTTSPKLAECMEALIMSLGMQSIINISDRTDEPCIIRDVEYKRNYPLYCVRWYSETTKRRNRSNSVLWKKYNNSLYFKIKSIEKIDYDEDVYCIECKNEEEPYFTLPNGVITHNCRLRSSLKELDDKDSDHNHTTHQYSMGTASVSTGSKSVMTMNLPRLIQNATRKYFEKKGVKLENGKNLAEQNLNYDKAELYEYIRNEVRDLTERVHKYQTAFNETIKDFYNANMLTVYNAGFIDLRRQYLTVGVNGITDAAEFLGIKVSPNDEYKDFVNNILETINIANRKDRTRDCMFNTEFVPGENLAVKNYKWDKKAGYWVSPNRNLYSSYFYNPEDTSLSVIDKMKMHGEEYVKYLDGGSACHVNLYESLSQKQYRDLLKIAAKNGCNYFTFNVKNTVCNNCGHIDKRTLDKCPKCGSDNLDYLTRVIGYLVRQKSMSEARQEEAEHRFYAKPNMIIK